VIVEGKKLLEGLFQNSKLNGFGRIIFEDGTSEQGYFKDDKPHGQGRTILQDGTVEDWIQIM